ncbi:MAG TPA: CPBP family intramembrane glutamic endopeptidase [Rhodanobacteraceae bacterium]
MTDYILLALLVGVMPLRAVCQSRRGTRATASRDTRHRKSIAIITGLLALLGWAWWRAGRTPALLGLDVPVSTRGLIGFGVAGAAVLALATFVLLERRKRSTASLEQARQRVCESDLLPRTRRELGSFLVFGLFAGCGWELLYRGFLLWWLTPRVGIVAAVCIAALAYGVAHGCRNRKRLAGSIVSAFAFTIAYALTGSLWWLMLIHTLAAVIGGISAYRLTAGEHGRTTPNAMADAAS